MASDPEEQDSKTSGNNSRDAEASHLASQEQADAFEQDFRNRGTTSDIDGPRYTQSGFTGKVINTVVKWRRGFIGVGIIGFLFAIFIGFLAPFKLMFMKENIDRVRLARMTHILDSRSDRFVNSLIAAEVAGDESGKNRYFVAKGWDREHPYYSFYEKITGKEAGSNKRINKFFDQIEAEKGYRFVRETSGVGSRDRLVRIELNNGQKIDFKGLANSGGLENLDDLVAERFETNKQARLAWKRTVKDNTRFYKVIKRYNMRKWGYEKLGITKWRFFEGTRENAEHKVRTRWTRAVAARSMDGSFLRCLTTPNGCPKSDSLNDEANKPGAPDSVTEPIIDEAEKEVSEETKDKKKITGQVASKIATKFIPVVNGLETAVIIVAIDDALGNGGLQRLVTAARAAEYASSYFTLATITDHLKAGEKVDGAEVNSVMKMFNGIERSDGYNQVMNTHTTASLSPVEKAYAQQNQDPEYARVTPELAINSAENRAAKMSNFYNGTFGVVVGPLADALKEVGGILSNIPLVGGAFDLVLGAIGKVIGLAVDGILWTFGAITGSDPEQILASLFTKLVEYFGGAPGCAGYDSAGRLFNCADGGAVATQEGFLEANGGHDISEDEHAEQSGFAFVEQQNEDSQRSTWSRLAALDGSNSVLANLVIKTPTSTQNAIAALSSSFASINPFGLSRVLYGVGNKSFSMISTAYAATGDSNLYGVKRKGLTSAELAKDPFDGKTQDECDAEADAHNEKISRGESSDGSLCLMDDMVANGLTCYNSDDPKCAEISTGEAPTDCTDPANTDAGQATGKVVLIGDSLMEGAVSAGLKSKLDESGFKSSTIDASQGRSITSGGTTGNRLSGMAAVDAKASAIRRANTVIIGLGTNPSGTPAEFEGQMRQMIDKIQDINGDATIYWINIFATKDPSLYSKYNDAIQRVADSKNLGIIDTKGITPGSDKLHPDAAGYQKLAEAIAGEAKSEDGQSCGGGGGAAVTGTAKELAEQILKNDKITYQTNCGVNVRDYFEKVAKGEKVPVPSTGGSVNIDPKLLAIILTLANNDIKLNISSLTNCGHSANSTHYSGKGVDIGNAGNGNAELTKAQSYLFKNRSKLRGINEVIWRGPTHEVNHQLDLGKPVGDGYFSDHTDHLHFSVMP